MLLLFHALNAKFFNESQQKEVLEPLSKNVYLSMIWPRPGD